MDNARHVITRIPNPRFMSGTASYDVASTIHQSSPTMGWWIRGGGRMALPSFHPGAPLPSTPVPVPPPCAAVVQGRKINLIADSKQRLSSSSYVD